MYIFDVKLAEAELLLYEDSELMNKTKDGKWPMVVCCRRCCRRKR